jgi:hypothetical protein
VPTTDHTEQIQSTDRRKQYISHGRTGMSQRGWMRGGMPANHVKTKRKRSKGEGGWVTLALEVDCRARGLARRTPSGLEVESSVQVVALP